MDHVLPPGQGSAARLIAERFNPARLFQRVLQAALSPMKTVRRPHKPGSVCAGGIPERDLPALGSHSSRRCIAVSLKQPTRTSRGETPLPLARREIPIWPCSRWGLPCRRCCQRPGALLPHPFTLACEVALHRRYTLCGTFPVLAPEGPCTAGVTRHLCFVEPGLSSSRGSRLPWPPDTHTIVQECA